MSVEAVEREAVERRADAVTLERNATPAFWLRDVRLLPMGLWLGASLFFSFVVAPSAFAVLRDSTALYANHLAGSIVTRNLAFINTSGFIIGLALLATAFVFRSRTGRLALTVEIISLAV